MGGVEVEQVGIHAMSDGEISAFLKKNSLALKVEECRKIVELLGRDPTLTEIHIFNIQWSEHSSYKSSKDTLKMLPTSGPTVILGPREDAGIIKFANIDGEQYGIVISHESHNHPSQVVPYEGAATGVGGNIRDVLCMGAHVISSADPLRFGNPFGKNKNRVKYIANQVVEGVAGYGNPLGVPIIAGDICFNDSFDENCLVNVVALGIIKEKEIIHSAAPPDSTGYDIVIVGKATDYSGFGGAALASVILDEDEEEFNKGAVQVPDPFLKNIIVRATEAVFAEIRKRGLTLGFKDMGAGGIMCSTSELCDAGTMGGEIDLDKVPIALKDLPPYVIACGETQERFTWISPPEFTPILLKIYNEDFELPKVAEGAQAAVIGKVTGAKNYILRHKGKIVCNAPVEVITRGIKYQRTGKEHKRKFSEPAIPEPKDYNAAVLSVLHHPNVASKASIFKHYDTEVQGLTVIRPGEADAGVQAPIPGKYPAVALSVDHNPKYSRISPFHGAVNAVAEAMRNVAAVGAIPYGMTDCLNMGNPEKPEAFRDFTESVEGLSVAAHKLWLKGKQGTPVPFVGGNVSFYNESTKGAQIDPSPIISCVGYLEDYRKAITMKLKRQGSKLFLIGDRKDELGGSAYYELNKETGANVPNIDLESERKRIHAVIDLIDAQLLESCHDISDGGLLTTVAEMILGGEADGILGADIDISFSSLRPDKALFSESPGFVFEVIPENKEKVEQVLKKYGINPLELGTTIAESKLVVCVGNKRIIELENEQLKKAWTTGVPEAMK